MTMSTENNWPKPIISGSALSMDKIVGMYLRVSNKSNTVIEGQLVGDI
jgi:hypothetical protein